MRESDSHDSARLSAAGVFELVASGPETPGSIAVDMLCLLWVRIAVHDWCMVLLARYMEVAVGEERLRGVVRRRRDSCPAQKMVCAVEVHYSPNT